MAYNGSGTFSRLYSWVTDRSNSIKIRSDRMDAEMDGIAAGLTNAICKDGQTTITADIPFNNHKITGLADASSATDALNRQSGDARYLGIISGLTTETTLADSDLFAMLDASASAHRGITYASIKSALTTDFRSDGRMFPVGTRMTFQQTTPPTGWTKESSATYENAAARSTTGTVTTGGATGFSSVFASKTPTGSIGAITLTIDNLPAHVHTDAKKLYNGVGGGSGNKFLVDSASNVSTGVNQDNPTTSSSVGSGSSFTPSFTGNAMDFAVKFVDFTIGQKA
jgi:hypothetical protein